MRHNSHVVTTDSRAWLRSTPSAPCTITITSWRRTAPRSAVASTSGLKGERCARKSAALVVDAFSINRQDRRYVQKRRCEVITRSGVSGMHLIILLMFLLVMIAVGSASVLRRRREHRRAELAKALRYERWKARRQRIPNVSANLCGALNTSRADLRD